MLSIRTDEALQMLEAGWTVRYCLANDCIEWCSPEGMRSSEFHSTSLDDPPEKAAERARSCGDIVARTRTAVLE